MTCPRCQQDNPDHARFCLGCGARLALACGSCGAELPGGARFCLQCGHAVAAGAALPVRSPAPETYTPKHLAEKILTSKAALEGERNQVTVLFADLKGSMELFADRRPAFILLFAGSACLWAGHIDEAAGYAGKAMVLTRRLGARASEAHALCLAGDVASTGGAAGAEGYYREALALAGELGMRPLVAHCHLGLGKLGKHDRARKHLETAITMYREMDMRFWLKQAEGG